MSTSCGLTTLVFIGIMAGVSGGVGRKSLKLYRRRTGVFLDVALLFIDFMAADQCCLAQCPLPGAFYPVELHDLAMLLYEIITGFAA